MSPVVFSLGALLLAAIVAAIIVSARHLEKHP